MQSHLSLVSSAIHCSTRSTTRNFSKGKRTDKVTVLHRRNARFSHSLLEHVWRWLAQEGSRTIVAVRDALEQVVHTKQLHDTLPVRNVGIRKEPKLHSTGVDVFDKVTKLGVRRQNALKGQSVVNQSVVLERIYFVVANKSFDSQTVILVVAGVQVVRFFFRQREMRFEILIYIHQLTLMLYSLPAALTYQLSHQIMDLFAFRVQLDAMSIFSSHFRLSLPTQLSMSKKNTARVSDMVARMRRAVVLPEIGEARWLVKEQGRKNLYLLLPE